jgi:cytochrome c oxidase cbb3-type subunit 3
MSLRFSGLLLAPLLLISSCQTSSHSAPGGSTFPDTANVGPIPGAVNVNHTTTDPYLKDATALQEGKRLFGWYNCAGCHGIHGGGGMGPSLRDAVWIYGDRDDQIMDTLIHGRSKGMPAWGSKIPEDQMWKLVAYIKSMNTPLEPDAPVKPAEEQIPSSDIYPPSDRWTQPR